MRNIIEKVNQNMAKTFGHMTKMKEERLDQMILKKMGERRAREGESTPKRDDEERDPLMGRELSAKKGRRADKDLLGWGKVVKGN